MLKFEINNDKQIITMGLLSMHNKKNDYMDITIMEMSDSSFIIQTSIHKKDVIEKAVRILKSQNNCQIIDTLYTKNIPLKSITDAEYLPVFIDDLNDWPPKCPSNVFY